MWLTLQRRNLQSWTEDCLAHDFFDLWFFHGTYGKCQGRDLRSLYDNGSTEVDFPPPFSENFEEFYDRRRGASLGIFGKFPGRAKRLIKIPPNFSPLIVGTTILKRGSSVTPVSGRGCAKRSAWRCSGARRRRAVAKTTSLFKMLRPRQTRSLTHSTNTPTRLSC